MTYLSEVLSDAPTTLYRLGEAPGAATALDSAGGAYAEDKAYTSGAATLGAPGLVPGDANTAASCNGTSQLITISFPQEMSSATMSVEALVKTTGTGTMAVADRDPSGNRRWSFRINAGSVEFRKTAGTIVTASSGAVTVNDGAVHHIAGTYDGITLRVYVDGIECGSAAATGSIGGGSSDGWALVGAAFNNTGGADFFRYAGVLDEVAFYGAALPAARVKAHADQIIPPPPPPPVVDDRYWTNRLAASLGLDPVAVQPVVEVRTWQAGAWTFDAALSHALAGYSVTYGRSGATGTADPITASLTLVTRLATATPEAATRLQVALCEPVATALGLSPAQAVRFTGEVTDAAVNHATRLTSLVCVGRLGRGNRAPVDGTEWPVEDDGDRVSRILTGTGLGLSVGTIDAGTATLAAPTRSEAAAKLLDLVVNSTGGQVVEQPEGVVDWHDANHRRGVNPALTLSASEVFRSITWTQRVGEVVNAATVKYAGGDIEVTDSHSADPVSGYGPYPASIDTALVDEEDAYALGTVLVGRRARPAWTLPDVLVDLIRTVPLADLTQLLALRHGHRLLIEGLPEACPVPPKVFVEGWSESATPRQWRQTIAVSDPMLSGISPRYIDVPLTDSYQYADVDTALTYLDVMRTEDPAELL